jgi:superfamily II DNA helicase RecQ
MALTATATPLVQDDIAEQLGLVGAARFTAEGEFVLQQFFMRDPSEEPALLDALGRFLAPAQAL